VAHRETESSLPTVSRSVMSRGCVREKNLPTSARACAEKAQNSQSNGQNQLVPTSKQRVPSPASAHPQAFPKFSQKQSQFFQPSQCCTRAQFFKHRVKTSAQSSSSIESKQAHRVLRKQRVLHAKSNVNSGVSVSSCSGPDSHQGTWDMFNFLLANFRQQINAGRGVTEQKYQRTLRCAGIVRVCG